jgi:hypothetical protein
LGMGLFGKIRGTLRSPPDPLAGNGKLGTHLSPC